METEGDIDVAWFAGRNSKHDDWEFKYSLRSVVQNFPRLRNIYLIGQLPKIIDRTKVIHIPFPDAERTNKDENLIKKIQRLAFEKDLSAHFLMMSDDHFIMNRVDDPKPWAEFHEDELDSFYGRDLNIWIRRLKRTSIHLRQRGFTGHNYDTHVPHLIEKAIVPETIEWECHGPGYAVFTLFLNIQHDEPTPEIITDSVRCSVRRYFEQTDVRNRLLTCTYAVCNDASFKNKEFTSTIEERFRKKTPYEL